MGVIKMSDLQGIRREALKDIINDLKVMEQVCYPDDDEWIDCRHCENYELCSTIFATTTPKQILDKLKEGTH